MIDPNYRKFYQQVDRLKRSKHVNFVLKRRNRTGDMARLNLAEKATRNEKGGQFFL